MEIGEHKRVEIHSNRYWNPTGVMLQVGECYWLTARGTWTDRTFVYTPAGGPSPKWYLRIVERFRRMPREPWFHLCGAIHRDRRTCFAIGARGRYEVKASGELTCFANDVPGFYGNNQGTISLTIERIG